MLKYFDFTKTRVSFFYEGSNTYLPIDVCHRLFALNKMQHCLQTNRTNNLIDGSSLQVHATSRHK